MTDRVKEKKDRIENFVTDFKPDWPTTAFYGEDGYEPEDLDAPFFSEAFLYNLIGKEDARSVLGIVEGLLEIAEEQQQALEALKDADVATYNLYRHQDKTWEEAEELWAKTPVGKMVNQALGIMEGK